MLHTGAPSSPCWWAPPSAPTYTEDKLAHIFSSKAKLRAGPRQFQPSFLSSTTLVTIYICWWGSWRLFLLLETVLKPTAQQKLHVCPGFASQMEEGGHSMVVQRFWSCLMLFPPSNLICHISTVLGTVPARDRSNTGQHFSRMLPTLPINRELQSPPRLKWNGWGGTCFYLTLQLL